MVALVSLAPLGDGKLGWRCVVCRSCSACLAGCPRNPISTGSCFVGINDIANPVEHSSSLTSCYCLRACLAVWQAMDSIRIVGPSTARPLHRVHIRHISPPAATGLGERGLQRDTQPDSCTDCLQTSGTHSSQGPVLHVGRGAVVQLDISSRSLGRIVCMVYYESLTDRTTKHTTIMCRPHKHTSHHHKLHLLSQPRYDSQG